MFARSGRAGSTWWTIERRGACVSETLIPCKAPSPRKEKTWGNEEAARAAYDRAVEAHEAKGFVELKGEALARIREVEAARGENLETCARVIDEVYDALLDAASEHVASEAWATAPVALVEVIEGVPGVRWCAVDEAVAMLLARRTYDDAFTAHAVEHAAPPVDEGTAVRVVCVLDRTSALQWISVEA